MFGSGFNMVTTVIGFGLSATFIVFVCARRICGRMRSADSQAATFDIELRSDRDTREHSVNALEAVAVAAIPTMKYNRDSFKSREDEQCSICLGDYQEKEILRVMPTCHHNFHLACIDMWFQKQSTCPICRLSLNGTFEVLPMFDVNSRELSSDHSSQWLMPSGHRSAGTQNNQQLHDSVSVHIEDSHGGEEGT